MTDELANIMVVHLRHWQAVERHFDADEHVESAWIPWKQLRDTHITASNSEIAICMSNSQNAATIAACRFRIVKTIAGINEITNSTRKRAILELCNQTWIDVSTRCELRRRGVNFALFSQVAQKSSFVFSMRKTVRPSGNDGAELLRMA